MTLNRLLRYFVLAGIFAIPFIPLVVTSGMFFPFITGKNFTFRIIVELIIVAWVILALRDSAYRPHRSWLLWAVSAYMLVLVVSTIFSVNPYRSFWSNFERMEGLLGLLHIFGYFVAAISVLNTRRLWHWLFHISLGAAIFVGVWGLLQLAGALEVNQGGVRVDATLGNATYLAIYMVFHIFLALYFLLRGSLKLLPPATSLLVGANFGFFIFVFNKVFDQVYFNQFQFTSLVLGGMVLLDIAILVWWLALKKYRRSATVLSYSLMLLLFLFTLYHTATRGAILGLIGGLILAAGGVAFFERGRAQKFALSGLAGILLVVAGFLALRQSDFVRESPVLGRFAEISLTETTTESRFIIAQLSWQGLKERPILGYGLENYNLVFNKYYDSRLWRQEQWFDRAHNVVIDQMISGGILGLLSYLSIFLAALYLIWKDRGHLSVRDKSIFVGLLAAYFFHNLFVFDNLISSILFYSLLGYLHTITRPTEAAALAAPTQAGVPVPAVPLPRPVQYGAAAAVLIALPFSLYFFNVKPIQASRTLIAALSGQPEGPARNLELYQKLFSLNTFGSMEGREQLVQATVQVVSAAGAPAEHRQAFAQLTAEELERQLKLLPNDTRQEMFASVFYRSIGDLNQSLVHALKALELSPRKQLIHFELVAIYLAANQPEQALEFARSAYELDPRYRDAAIIYAATAIYANQKELADQLLEPIYGDKAHDEDRLLRAYVEKGHYREVLKIWQSRVENEPANAQHRLALAAAYLALGERQRAIAEITKAVELDPSLKDQAEFYIEEIRAGRNP